MTQQSNAVPNYLESISDCYCSSGPKKHKPWQMTAWQIAVEALAGQAGQGLHNGFNSFILIQSFLVQSAENLGGPK